MDLPELRNEIDRVDKELVRLFEERMAISAQIAGYKREKGLPVFDPVREKEKLESIASIAAPEFRESTRVLYSTLFELSRSYQSGKNLSHTEQWAEVQSCLSCNAEGSAVIAVRESHHDMGQKLCGSLFPHFSLHGYPDVTEALKTGACDAAVVTAQDGIAMLTDPDTALYINGCLPLAGKPAYLCISKKPLICPEADRTALLLTLPLHTGTLYRLLCRFDALGIPVIRMESHPAPGDEKQIAVYAELQVSVPSPAFRQLICELPDLSRNCRYLGSYIEVI